MSEFEGFYRAIKALDEEVHAMRQAWYANDWREMAARAVTVAVIAEKIADEAAAQAVREDQS